MTPTELRFTEDDFHSTFMADGPALSPYDAAEQANSRIDAYFKDADYVYGFHEQDGIHDWSFKKGPDDSHVGLLVGVKEIKRGVTVAEVVETLRFHNLNDTADRIEREGILG